MSERKVLSKYYPHDFDPRQYIGKGTKFNARKGIADETHIGIIIFRFFIQCPQCAAEITYKTDPQTGDYACERGAARSSQAWRPSDTEEETTEERIGRLEQDEQQQQGKQGHGTTIKQLEKHTLVAETDIAFADALDEIQLRNAGATEFMAQT
ncbi:hypothetical protein S40285_05061 [Stachybotrys chlorohalonatus IBT 40285]|uniref:Splicing factor YJU2 n=1 Tax=Stachybotrys chlorohalonatus (strain IBT 40285) TaxID=1283841 RepID=A0A084Q9R0_STAC4|nr:hypothetical protein S40285_05061 [Stachybotrys chlorohalonata IBT 40285]